MARPRRTIANLMWLVALAAIWLVATRGGRDTEWVARYWFLMALGAVALHWTWFVLVPHWSLDLAGGDRERQSHLLRWVINTPIPGGPRLRGRLMLAANDHAAGRYEEAEAGLRSILEDSDGGQDLPPGMESGLRRQLAGSLAAMGRLDEAAAERARAGRTAVAEDRDTTRPDLRAEGELLAYGDRYADAITYYEKALDLAPLGEVSIRSDLMMRLASSTLRAGRPAEALRWAEAVIALDPTGPRCSQARLLTAVACGNLGRLAEAERHARDGFDLAPKARFRAESLALRASCTRRRGELDEAERIAHEAEALLPGTLRTPWLVMADIEKDRGRLEEAIRALERARTIRAVARPAAIRRIDAVNDRGLALCHADLGDHRMASTLVRRAESVLAADLRLAPAMEAAAALILALAHQRDRAVIRIDSAETSRRVVPEDPSIQREVLSLLARAALAIDEPARAEGFLRAYLEIPPDPIELPHAWYLLGCCRRRLGDEAGGRECDLNAAATRYGSIWEGRARERLAAEGVSA